jgi:long-chain acyl-CoA synthetase
VTAVPDLTLPGLLAKLAHEHPREVALRHKQYGLWNEVSYAEYLRQAGVLALGLRKLGLKRGDRVALLCENTPLWLYAQLGVQAAGGVSVGLYPAMTGAEVAAALDGSGASWAVVQGEEQIDKLLELQATHPLQKVIYGSERGMRKHAGHPGLLSVDGLWTLIGEPERAELDALIAQGTPDELAHLTLTGGTTGPARAVMVTHRQLLAVGRALLDTDPLHPGDDHLSFLPLAWSGEQLLSVSVALQSRLTVNFPESSETAMTDLAELGPQVMYTPPRIWEELRSSLLRRIKASYGLNRQLSRLLLNSCEQAATLRLSGKPVPAGLKLRQGAARWLLTRPVLDRAGLLRLRRAYVTGAALSPELARFFHALGVDLRAAYGQAESLGLSHVQRGSAARFGTVGTALPGAEARVADGSLHVRMPWQSSGYYGQDASTQQATAERWQGGWLHSGDAGALDEDGQLSVRGRASELCRTLGGQQIEPQAYETRLKLSPYIGEALVLAEAQDAPTALIALDAGAVGSWAESRRLPYTSFAELSQRPEVAALIRTEVEAANAGLSEAVRIRRFALLHKPLDADDGELTRTGTVRRGVVLSRYASVVAGLRAGATEVRLGADIEPDPTTEVHAAGRQPRHLDLTIALHHLGPAPVPTAAAPTAARSLA